jgi:CheY-like chemotaxis protein
MRVLIVEDTELNRDMLGRRLQRSGHEVVFAEDGLAGVECARRERPDIVLMDMSLPVLDGWTATQRIKAEPDTREIPVVALTAHALVEERQRALDAGCDGFHTKPIDLPSLLATMVRLCQARPADDRGPSEPR